MITNAFTGKSSATTKIYISNAECNMYTIKERTKYMMVFMWCFGFQNTHKLYVGISWWFLYYKKKNGWGASLFILVLHLHFGFILHAYTYIVHSYYMVILTFRAYITRSHLHCVAILHCYTYISHTDYIITLTLCIHITWLHLHFVSRFHDYIYI